MTDTLIADTLAAVPPPTLVAGFNHVATVTHDLDRLVAFYAQILDVRFVELPDPRSRHGLLVLGGSAGAALHLFEVPVAVTGPLPETDTMFRRGRLDHFAIHTASEAALLECRDRIVAAGAGDGTIRVFGGRLLSLHVIDPDGVRFEVVCNWERELIGDDDVVVAH